MQASPGPRVQPASRTTCNCVPARSPAYSVRNNGAIRSNEITCERRHDIVKLDDIRTICVYDVIVTYSSRDVRLLLRRARRPYELRANRLMQRIVVVSGASDERTALILLLRKTFVGSADRTALKAVLASDFQGRPSEDAAALLNVSLRQYYRYRAKGFQAVADTVNQMLSSRGNSIVKRTRLG